MKAYIEVQGLGLVNNPSARIVLRKKGQADLIFQVDKLFISDDTGVLSALCDAFGIPEEGEFN